MKDQNKFIVVLNTKMLITPRKSFSQSFSQLCCRVCMFMWVCKSILRFQKNLTI